MREQGRRRSEGSCQGSPGLGSANALCDRIEIIYLDEGEGLSRNISCHVVFFREVPEEPSEDDQNQEKEQEELFAMSFYQAGHRKLS